MIPNVNRILVKLLSNRLGRQATGLELVPRIKAVGSELPELTEAEVKAVSDMWGQIGHGLIDFDYWRFYMALSKGNFSPGFVPDNIYWSRIIRALNPASLTRTYINKSLYPIIFKGLRQPEVLVNCINGVYYDAKMDRISQSEAVGILHTYNDNIIIKPTTSTSGGSGVTKIHQGTSAGEIGHIISKYGKNFICQGQVRQSESTAVFNESSLNTFRVNTLNINGETTCECIMMRHGINGSYVDNFAAGGIVCGMNGDGSFNGNNYNTRLEKVTQLSDGTSYASLSVPNISRVIQTSIEAHQRYMPHIGHAAWDFALDENDAPLMIEVNLMLPGIIMEQATSGGSIFGNRTEEVISYAAERNNKISWTEFVGGWE